MSWISSSLSSKGAKGVHGNGGGAAAVNCVLEEVRLRLENRGIVDIPPRDPIASYNSPALGLRDASQNEKQHAVCRPIVSINLNLSSKAETINM